MTDALNRRRRQAAEPGATPARNTRVGRDKTTPAPRSTTTDIAMFLAGGAMLFVTVYLAVPRATAAGLEPIASWMLLAVLMIFTPLVVAGVILLRAESCRETWRRRLWLEQPSASDWLWGIAGVIAIAIGSAAMFGLCGFLGLDPNPPFTRDVRPVTSDRLWLVALWAVYWPLNILGEEFVWRGVLLPRMEARFGNLAWILNAALWGIFHAAFGIGNALVLLPTLLFVPLVAQRRRSTWLAVLMHGGLSLPAFVSLALGVGPR